MDNMEMDDSNYLTHSFDARTARILVQLIEDIESFKAYLSGSSDDADVKEALENDESKTTASKHG